MRLLLVFCALLLAACGQAGDLYLPPEQSPAADTPAPADAPDQDRKKP